MLACGLLAMLATRYPNLRIAPMTAAILFVSPQSHASPLISGLHRVLEIAIGCCVGIAVALLVAPARAESRLRAEVGHALGLIAKLITLGIEAPDGQTNDDSVATVSEDIYAASRALDALSQESRAERSSHLSRSRLDPERLQRALRKLRMVAFALEHVTRLSWPILDPGRARSLRTAIVSAHDYLMALGPALVAGAQPPPLKALETSLVQFANTAAVTHHTRGVGEAIHPSSDQPLSKARDQTEAFVGAISLTLDELHLALEELVECIADAGSDSA
jgi:hypothetical protein